MAKTKVLHLIDTLGVGGAEKLVIGGINGLPQHEHHLIHLNGPDTLKKELISECKVLNLECRNPFHFFRAIFRIRNYIIQNKIEIVHSHLCVSTLIARLACPQHVKMFTTIHNLPSKGYFDKSKLLTWAEKLTYRSRHHIVAICNEVYRDYKKCIGIKGPYTILYNYIENKFFQPKFKRMSFNGTLRLVAVGTLKYQKNYPYLIETFKKLPKSIHLDIYGEGHLREQLQQEIDKHNLSIRLCGIKHNVEELLPQYDALVMSSHYEGQPLAVLEAMASGIPLILSDIPVLREVTDDNGIFFDLDNTDDLVQKLTAIAEHKVNLDTIASANHFRAGQIARKENYINILNRLYLQPDTYYRNERVFTPVKTLRPGLSPSIS